MRADLSCFLHRSLFRNVAAYHCEYANSLGESLLTYLQRTEALRFGISLVR